MGLKPPSFTHSGITTEALVNRDGLASGFVTDVGASTTEKYFSVYGGFTSSWVTGDTGTATFTTAAGATLDVICTQAQYNELARYLITGGSSGV